MNRILKPPNLSGSRREWEPKIKWPKGDPLGTQKFWLRP